MNTNKDYPIRKDLPFYLFSPNTNTDAENPAELSTNTKIESFNYKYLASLELNNRNDTKVDSLTQMFYFGDCLVPTTRLLPCSLPSTSK